MLQEMLGVLITKTTAVAEHDAKVILYGKPLQQMFFTNNCSMKELSKSIAIVRMFLLQNLKKWLKEWPN